MTGVLDFSSRFSDEVRLFTRSRSFELGDLEAEVIDVETFQANFERKVCCTLTLVAGHAGGGKSDIEDGGGGKGRGGNCLGKSEGVGVVVVKLGGKTSSSSNRSTSNNRGIYSCDGKQSIGATLQLCTCVCLCIFELRRTQASHVTFAFCSKMISSHPLENYLVPRRFSNTLLAPWKSNLENQFIGNQYFHNVQVREVDVPETY